MVRRLRGLLPYPTPQLQSSLPSFLFTTFIDPSKFPFDSKPSIRIMHRMIIAATPSNPLPTPTPCPAAHRPVAPDFAPSPWGDRFLDYSPDIKVIESQQELARELKEDVKRELLSIFDKPLMEQLHLIDSIERLSVAYHFEKEIEDALRRIHEMPTNPSSDDLVLTALRFRLLRQHGFKVSSDVFKEFIGSSGSLKEEIANDVQGMLSLYEACHVRVHGEEFLDEALPFTMSNLIKSIPDQQFSSHSSLEQRIRHALKKPLQKMLLRVDSVRYMQAYEDDLLHNETLLKFAKLDFNLLQSSHKKELSQVYMWWKRIDASSKLPLRDRIVESFFWATSVFLEPQHPVARKVSAMGAQILASVDDIYDAYATIEELEIFTEIVQRWDKTGLDQLPEDLRWFYETLLFDAHEEIERDLAPKGRSQYVHYVKEEVKALCRSYMTEAKWRQKKYIPTLEEYMENDLYRNTAYVAAIVYTFLDEDTATDVEFQWLCNLSKPVKAVCHVLRILNDIGGNKFDENRGLSSLYMECYMKQYGISSYEQACEELYEKANQLWKDVNESMIRPTEVSMPVIKCVVNMGRAVEIIYDGGEDGFTLVNKAMKHNIETLFVGSIPM